MIIYEVAFFVAIALIFMAASGIAIALWLILSKRYEVYQERYNQFLDEEARIRAEMKKRRKSFDL